MAVAEERKQVDAIKAQVSEYRQHHEKALDATLAHLTAFRDFMNSQVGTPPPVELASQDVGLYIAQKEQYENRKDTLNKTFEAISNVEQEKQRQRQAWIAQQADETEKALRSTLPGFGDNTLNELADYLGKSGLTPQAAGEAFVQKGLWELAHKAKAYDALQEQKSKLKPIAQLAKVQKPKASNQPNREQVKKANAQSRYKANPSLQTLADLL